MNANDSPTPVAGARFIAPASSHEKAGLDESSPYDANSPWLQVCSLDDIPLSGARVLRIAGRDDIALFRTLDDRVFALRDQCPHKGGPLSQGIVHGARVTCPLHAWVIDLDSGAAVEPDVGHTACYRVRLDGNKVLLHRDDLARRAEPAAAAASIACTVP